MNLPATARREPIGGGVNLYVSTNHTFGTDAILLADFAAPKPNDCACDLGTGCGVIPFRWFLTSPPKSATGIELQAEAVALARQSLAEMPEHQGRLRFFEADLCKIASGADKRLAAGGFTLVSCNPPYSAPGAGKQNESEARRIARHEIACRLGDVVDAAARLLTSGGRFCMCHRPDRLAELFCLLSSARLEPKRLRLVCQRPNEAPWLILAEAKKDAKPGLTILPPLYLEDGSGNLTGELLKIYGNYKEGRC